VGSAVKYLNWPKEGVPKSFRHSPKSEVVRNPGNMRMKALEKDGGMLVRDGPRFTLDEIRIFWRLNREIRKEIEFNELRRESIRNEWSELHDPVKELLRDLGEDGIQILHVLVEKSFAERARV